MVIYFALRYFHMEMSSGKINHHTMQYFLSTKTDNLDQRKGVKGQGQILKIVLFCC
jgi:hypothetical protein